MKAQYKGSYRLIQFPQSVNFVGNFHDGIAVASCSGFNRTGLINSNGGWVVAPHYSSVVAGERTVARMGDECFFLDAQGKPEGNRYDDIATFVDGVAAAKRNGRYGVIDVNENEIVPFSHDNIGIFSCSLARITDNGANGYINTHGVEVIPRIYGNAATFSEGLASIMPNNSRKWGVIDADGNHQVAALYDDIGRYVNGMAMFNRGAEVGFLNLDFEEVMPCHFDNCTHFSPEGVAVYEIDDEYGVFRRSGEVLSRAQYNTISMPSCGLMCCSLEHMSGYINLDGINVIPHRYTLARSFNEGLAAVKKDGKWGYINTSGDTVIAHSFSQAFDFVDGLAVVADERGLQGIIDAQGNIIVPCSFDDIDYCKEGIFFVKKGTVRSLLVCE